MLIFVVIGAPSDQVLWNRHGIRDAAGGGIHRISSGRAGPIFDKIRWSNDLQDEQGNGR
jgi:hypothetical protein